MNLAFRREIIPAFYQLPMDDNPWKIGRFDDIWSGFFVKKVADVLNKWIITGYPLCIHNKSKRNGFKDLIAEANGLEINEILWKVLKDLNVDGNDFLDVYGKIVKMLENKIGCFGIHKEFIKFMIQKQKKWIEIISKL